MLQVQNIHYKINQNLSLSNISFEARAGELVAILGANGAGKSTLLHILTGTLKMDQGTVLMNERSIHLWHPKERACFCAVLQQQNSLQLPFTVREVVMIGRYPHFKSTESKMDESIVAKALEQTGLSDLKERNYMSLSGGEQQRVHLARVLAQVAVSAMKQPAYLFMDEPSNNLDIRYQHSTLALAQQFAKKGNCVLAVLHDLNLALQYADKILLLKQGQMKSFGPTKQTINNQVLSDVFDMPLNVFQPTSDSPSMVQAIYN